MPFFLSPMNNAGIIKYNIKYNNVAKNILEKMNKGKIILSLILIELLNLFVFRNSGPMMINFDCQMQVTNPSQINIVFVFLV
jgi:hypothetical protein